MYKSMLQSYFNCLIKFLTFEKNIKTFLSEQIFFFIQFHIKLIILKLNRKRSSWNSLLFCVCFKMQLFLIPALKLKFNRKKTPQKSVLYHMIIFKVWKINKHLIINLKKK